MRLISVYEVPGSIGILYDLLAEREPWQSISHKEMPTVNQHAAFLESMPYMGWWLIDIGEFFAGACYITKQREIGVHIFSSCRGCGYGSAAVREVMQRFPGRVLANISPQNSESEAMFERLGFSHIQNTYAHE